MTLPPAFVKLRVVKPGEHNLRLWLPVFLLWPLLLALTIVVLVMTILADVVLIIIGSRYHHSTQLLIGGMDLVGKARGLTLAVDNKDSTVALTVR